MRHLVLSLLIVMSVMIGECTARRLCIFFPLYLSHSGDRLVGESGTGTRSGNRNQREGAPVVLLAHGYSYAAHCVSSVGQAQHMHGICLFNANMFCNLTAVFALHIIMQ